jgi:hypothetical protein
MGTEPSKLKVVQRALDALQGTNADYGFFHSSVTGKRVYLCSIRLASGDLAYGTGATLAEAHERAHSDEPIRRKSDTQAA